MLIEQTFQKLPGSAFLDKTKKSTGLVIVDMINGFLTEGVLASERCHAILPAVTELLQFATEHDLPCVAFADSHEPDCPEFQTFPPHCLKNTSESELAAPLCRIGGFQRIDKNSTNGFLTPDFQNFLQQHPELEQILVCGVCTDICVMQFALTLQAFCNQNQKKMKILVPVNAVETYDAPGHDAAFMQDAALRIMQQAGIILIQEVECHA